MKKSALMILVSGLLFAVGCASVQEVDQKVKIGTKSEPGQEYEYLGDIYLGKYVLGGGGKIAADTVFAASSKLDAVRKMKEMTYNVGGNYMYIVSIEEGGSTDDIRYFGQAKAYKLKASYGSVEYTHLTEQGHLVQYVVRMEPGSDYEVISAKKTDNGFSTGEKGEITSEGKNEDESIVIMRNIAGNFGASLLVVDKVEKDESKNPAVFKGSGRLFVLKKK